MPRITETFFAKDRATWRAWLRRHHARKRELWLLLGKKHARRRGILYDEAIEEALCFGWIDGVVKRFDDDYRALRLTPRRAGSVWSQLNKARVGRLIRQGLMTEAGMVHVRAAKRSGEWARATRRQSGRLPRDLSRALAASRAAKTWFDAQPPSYRKVCVYWVEDAKRPETRARRVSRIVQASAVNRRLY